MFKFELGELVEIALTEDIGSIRGRVEYTDSETQYYIYYKNAQGLAVFKWFDESLLIGAQHV